MNPGFSEVCASVGKVIDIEGGTPLQNWSKYNKSSFKEDMVYVN